VDFAGAPEIGDDMGAGTTSANESNRSQHKAAVKWAEQLETLVDVLLQTNQPDATKALLEDAKRKEDEAQARVDELQKIVEAETAAALADSEPSDERADNNKNNDAFNDATDALHNAKAFTAAVLSVLNENAGHHRARQFWPYDDKDASDAAIVLMQDQIAELQQQVAQAKADALAAVTTAVEQAKAATVSSEAGSASPQAAALQEKLAIAEASALDLQTKLECERAQHTTMLNEATLAASVAQQEAAQTKADLQARIEQLQIELEGVRKERDVLQSSLEAVSAHFGISK
jgi:hypothetical protein